MPPGGVHLALGLGLARALDYAELTPTVHQDTFLLSLVCGSLAPVRPLCRTWLLRSRRTITTRRSSIRALVSPPLYCTAPSSLFLRRCKPIRRTEQMQRALACHVPCRSFRTRSAVRQELLLQTHRAGELRTAGRAAACCCLAVLQRSPPHARYPSRLGTCRNSGNRPRCCCRPARQSASAESTPPLGSQSRRRNSKRQHCQAGRESQSQLCRRKRCEWPDCG